MKSLSDKAVDRLRAGAKEPDLSGTPYRLLEKIARGGMGVVYAAEDRKLERRVALKVLDVIATGGDLGERLIREARILARLEHPGIVPVHDVGTLADGRVFYAMKFVEGQRLDEFIESVPSVQDRLRLFLRVCDAVAFAHARGVLHRDLKPANIMVGPFGEVLVMDWGLAKIMHGLPHLVLAGANSQNSLPEIPETSRHSAGKNESTKSSVVTGHGTVLGTPGYMSPEQSRGEVETLDARSDIFSLGALLRFTLARKSAPGAALRLERSLEAICAKASSENRDLRYATVPELAADVSRYLDGLAVGAHRESILEKMGRLYRRYRFFILLILAYLAMRVLLLLFLHR